MYDLSKLCRRIHMPEEVTNIVLSHEKGEKNLGFQTLSDHLTRACEAWEDYQKLGLSDEIFIDTMACFSRFVREHKVSFGCYGFDRGFWTTRQTGCKLFRIGMLEYELLVENGEKTVSIHIPSDAELSLPLLRASYDMAKPLIDKTFPEFADALWICGSWLLSPDLKALLPAESKILKFQQSFALTKTYVSDEFKEWVYKREDIPNENLPEDTTLQRNLKTFLLSGNVFRCGEGTLIPDPFQ